MISFKQYVAEQSIAGGFNIPRSSMPQINDQDAFAAYLAFIGVGVEKSSVHLGAIQPTQTSFDPEKVAAINAPYGSIIIGEDKFILDGHHRFFAAMADDQCSEIDCYVCMVPINQLLKHAYEFLSDE